ncbi:MAG: DUF2282 domain-containing protein [Gammaproteobacteria bacterium]
MERSKILATAAITGMLTLAMHSPAIAKTADVEKCYGIAKAGKNDCGSKDNGCSAQSTADRDPDAWIYVLKGTCHKIVGGSTTPATKAQ